MSPWMSFERHAHPASGALDVLLRRHDTRSLVTKAMPVVIHSLPIWLPQTQTWIHTQVAGLQHLGIEAHVVCERTEHLGQFGVANIHSLDREGSARRIWDRALRKLRIRRHLGVLTRVGRKVGARIVHSHFGNVGWANLEAANRLGAKHVVTFYGFDVNQLPARWPVWRQRYRELFSEVDLVLCEGSHMRRCIIELGCPEGKVKVHHLGVAVDEIPFLPRRWVTGEPLCLLIAASFREKKGIPYAVEAIGKLARDIPIRLTIIGDAGRDEASQAEKRRILEALDHGGVRMGTRLMGYQPHKALLREAYAHHIFVQASVTAANGDTEGGAPVGIIEMLATGMLVVGSKHCDIPEVMGPAMRELLAAERDAAAIERVLRDLAARPESWGPLADRGRAHVAKEYDRHRQNRRLAEHYAELG
jgi:colanic acid/amylovoran biosynthesis glycosyltransferase